MSDAAIARTYTGTVDNSYEAASYTGATTLVETGQQVQVAVFKAANVEVQNGKTPIVDLTTSQALNLNITKSTDKLTVHLDLNTNVDVTFRDSSGVLQHFSAGVAISGDLTLTISANDYTGSASACGKQLQMSAGPSGSEGKLVISGFDLSAATSLFFSDGSSSGSAALILEHNKVANFASATVTDGDSSADAAATVTGALALAMAFLSTSQGNDPFAGYTPYDILMLKALGLDAAVISADPSTAQSVTVLTTYLGAGLALDYVGRALAVADHAPTDLALNANSDSGAKGDRLTNDRTVQIDGKVGARDTVTLYDGTKVVGSAVADAAGVFHVVTTTLTDGLHNLVATVTDPTGINVSSDPIQITVDGASPSAPMVTDLSASGLAGLAEAGSSVAIFDAGRLVGTVSAGADGHWTLPRTVTDTATHSYTLTSTDAAGNSTTSNGVALIKQATSGSLTGTAGDDLLVARPGEVLTGGAGHDHFVFDLASGKATIADFIHGQDVIEVDPGLAPNFAALMSHATQTSAGVVISLDLTHTITLKSETISSLTSSDFLFG